MHETAETIADTDVTPLRRGVRRFLGEYDIEPALFAELASVDPAVVHRLLTATGDPDETDQQRIEWVLSRDYVWENGKLRLRIDHIKHAAEMPALGIGQKQARREDWPYRQPMTDLTEQERAELAAQVETWITKYRSSRAGFCRQTGVGASSLNDLINGRTRFSTAVLTKIRNGLRVEPEATPGPAGALTTRGTPSDILRREIQDFVARHDLTLEDTQRILGVTKPTMKNIINGKRIFDQDYIRMRMLRYEEDLKLRAGTPEAKNEAPEPQQMPLQLAPPSSQPDPSPSLLEEGIAAICKRLDRIILQNDALLAHMKGGYQWR